MEYEFFDFSNQNIEEINEQLSESLTDALALFK